jgi:hypothetical protein
VLSAIENVPLREQNAQLVVVADSSPVSRSFAPEMGLFLFRHSPSLLLVQLGVLRDTQVLRKDHSATRLQWQ